MKRFFIIFLLISVLTSPLSGVYAQRENGASTATATAAAVPVARQVADRITAAQLRDYLTFIAADELEGRDTPSRGLDTAAKFIAFNLSRLGLKPAGDNGSYFQRIALHRYKINSEQSHAEVGNQTYKFGDDFLAVLPPAGKGLPMSASGQLVYVGNGWMIKSKNMDAYKGVDVKDKIMVVSGSGLPAGMTRAEIQGTRGVDWADAPTYAQMRGAKGIMLMPGFQNLAFWDRIRRNATERGQITVEKFEQQQSEPQVPTIIASLGMLNVLFRGEPQSASGLFSHAVAGAPGAAFDLKADKRAAFTVGGQAAETMSTQNVVAVLEGSDPVLKNEYVALGAHYDHVGIGAPVGGDSIYNGADDDGSGTTALLAIAEALAHSTVRPKRSILFVWHCGEEKGLWGSKYFTQNPTVPLDRVVAQLNIDMIGRSKKEGDTSLVNAALSGPNEIYVIGSKMMSTELGELSERVNNSYLKLSFNYKYDDPKDPERFFFRSDHFNYARKGIPIIFYFDGTHEDYHQPGDSVEKIDFEKMQKVTRTIFMTMWELSNAPTRPRVDKQLPPELR
ncbi:MAG: M20/M25/M40 family metallo-hydrolase [Pyrinomonadaceae bacterium]